MSTCTAKWKGGECDREAKVGELCSGHYAQGRREKPFAALKGAHGKPAADLVPVMVRVPKDDADTLEAEATRRGVVEADIYREAVAAYAVKLRKRKGA